VKIHFLGCVEPPELALVSERFPCLVQIPRIAMLVFYDEFRDGRPGAGTTLCLTLTSPSRVRLALVPCSKGLGVEVVQAERLSRLLPLNGIGEFAQETGFDPL
jgi:hypothetical protein